MKNRTTRSALLAVALTALLLPGCWKTHCEDREESAVAGDETLLVCPPVDIVFVMDTSGSMEDDAAALCATISSVESELRARGLKEIRTTLLGIVNTPSIVEDGAYDSAPGSEFGCLTNTVYRIAGGDGVNHPMVPGSPPGPTELENGDFVDPTILDPGINGADESWGPGTALVAELFPWLPDPAQGAPTIRVIVPISDESPQSGEFECYSVDDPAVQNALQVAQQNGVIVSPILGSTSSQLDPCIPQLMLMLATGTGGTFTDSNLPGFDLAESLYQIVLSACEQIDGPPPS